MMTGSGAWRGSGLGNSGGRNNRDGSGTLGPAPPREPMEGTQVNPSRGSSYRKSNGATRRDRTGDLLITNQPLYQLS